MKKTNEILIFMAVFCHNSPNNTHKTDNNRKAHALVTKRKKMEIWKISTGYSKVSFRKKIVKASF